MNNIIASLMRDRSAHIAQAEYHDGEARDYREHMKREMAKAVERRARAWECEQAIIRLGGTVKD